MELRDGEFMFHKYVAGNTVMIVGLCMYNPVTSEWEAKINGEIYGDGDSSDDAVMKAICSFLGVVT